MLGCIIIILVLFFSGYIIPIRTLNGVNSILKEIPDKERIAYSYSVHAVDEIDFSDIPTIAVPSDLIVYGTITDISYQVGEGMVRTIEEFQVLECFYGDLYQGSMISISVPQGYCRVNEYLASFSSKYHFKEESFVNRLSEEVVKNGRYDCIEYNSMSSSVHSEEGMNVIYCLRENDGYYPMDDYMARFIEVEAGLFRLDGDLDNYLFSKDKVLQLCCIDYLTR